MLSSIRVEREQDPLLFLLPHVNARHMSIIHGLVDFSKLEKKERKKSSRRREWIEKANQCGKACDEREREREKERQNGYDDRFTILPENSVKRS